jgi:hypothetical protein
MSSVRRLSAAALTMLCLVEEELSKHGLVSAEQKARTRVHRLYLEPTSTVREAVVLEITDDAAGATIYVEHSRFHQDLPAEVVQLGDRQNPPLAEVLRGEGQGRHVVRFSKEARPSSLAAEIRTLSRRASSEADATSIAEEVVHAISEWRGA